VRKCRDRDERPFPASLGDFDARHRGQRPAVSESPTPRRNKNAC
jgi:hypothetical protein